MPRPDPVGGVVYGRSGATINRQGLSGRHVPDEIVQVAATTCTITGKKLELPVKKLLLGQPLDKVLKRDALAQPASIDWCVDFVRACLQRRH